MAILVLFACCVGSAPRYCCSLKIHVLSGYGRFCLGAHSAINRIPIILSQHNIKYKHRNIIYKSSCNGAYAQRALSEMLSLWSARRNHLLSPFRVRRAPYLGILRLVDL